MYAIAVIPAVAMEIKSSPINRDGNLLGQSARLIVRKKPNISNKRTEQSMQAHVLEV